MGKWCRLAHILQVLTRLAGNAGKQRRGSGACASASPPLEQHAQQEADEAAAAHDLHVLVGRLDEVVAKVRAGLADADWHLRREIIRALVKEIEVTTEQITVVFRIGPQSLGPGPPLDRLPHCLSHLAAQARASRRVGGGAEATGDPLLDVEHAQVALGLIVIEGDA